MVEPDDFLNWSSTAMGTRYRRTRGGQLRRRRGARSSPTITAWSGDRD